MQLQVMMISVLVHGTIKSIRHRKNMFKYLFDGIEIGGIITSENGYRTVLKEEKPKKKSKKRT